MCRIKTLKSERNMNGYALVEGEVKTVNITTRLLAHGRVKTVDIARIGIS